MTSADVAALARAQTLGEVDTALAEHGYEPTELPRRVVRELAGLR